MLLLPIHTILHPTDFSEQSSYALGLARDYDARLILLHVAPPRAVVAHPELISALVQDQAEQRQHLDRLSVPDGISRVDRRIEQGDPSTEILRMAEENNADLIAMGTHGRG